jgi:WD40 repeat protein
MDVFKPGLAATILALGMIGLNVKPASSQNENSDPAVKSSQTEGSSQRLDLFGDPLPDGVVARLGSYRWRDGHGGFPAVAIFPNGKSLPSGVRIWDIETGKKRAELKLNSRKSISCLSPDGKTLAVGGEGQIILWDIETDRQTQILTMPGNTSDQSRLNPGSKTAAPTGNPRVDWITFSPDGRVLATGTSPYQRRVDPRPPVILWDWRQAKPLVTLPPHVGGLTAIAFSRDGRMLATANQDKEINLWETGSGKRLQMVAVDQEVCDVAFSAAQGKFASVEVDGSVYLWNVEGDKLVNRKKVGQLGSDQVRFNGCFVGFSGDGNTLVYVCRSGFLCIYNIQAGRHILRRFCGASNAAFTPDGQSVAVPAGHLRVRFWDLATGKERIPEIGHGTDVRSIAFSADGKEVFTTAKGDAIRVWDPTTGRLQRTIEVKSPSDTGQASISEDRKMFARLADQSVELLDTSSGNPIREFPAPKAAAFTELALAPNGSLLATVDRALIRQGSRLVSSGAYSLRVWNVADGKELRRLAESTEQFGPPAFSPDGKFVAAPSNNWTLSIWQTSKGEAMTDIEIGGKLNVAVSPNGQLIAIARMKAIGAKKTEQGAIKIEIAAGEVQIREFPSGKLIRTLPLGELPVRANRVFVNLPVWSQDGRRLALAVAYDTSIWDVLTGKRVRLIRGGNPVAFSPVGNRLAASAAHGVAHIWELSGTPNTKDD